MQKVQSPKYDTLNMKPYMRPGTLEFLATIPNPLNNLILMFTQNLDSHTPEHVEFWESILEVANWELLDAKAREAASEGAQTEIPANAYAQTAFLMLNGEVFPRVED